MIRGPLDADRFRTTYRRSRHYIDPLPPCEIQPEAKSAKDDRLPAFSTIKKVLAGTFKKRWDDGQTYDLDALRCARYVAEHREHLLKLDDGGVIAAVAGEPTRALNAAAARGTGVHAMLENKVKGEAFDRDWLEIYHSGSVDYFDVVERFWSEQKPEIGYEEIVGLNWAVGYGCTADATAVKLTSLPGELLAIDYKTRGPDSSHASYEQEAMQLAAATFVEYIFVQNEDGTVGRQRPPKLDRGVIVSIKPDSYELYPVDLEAAWEAWLVTVETWQKKKLAMSLGGKSRLKPIFLNFPEPSSEAPATATDPAVEAVQNAFPGAERIDDPFAGLPQDDGTAAPDRTALSQALIARIVKLDGAKGIEWPAGVSTFKQIRDAGGGLHTLDELKQIEVALDRFEGPPPVDTPVPADDPRVVAIRAAFDGFNEEQRQAYIERTKGLTPKPSSGQCRNETFIKFEAIVADLLHSEPVADVASAGLVERAIASMPVAGDVFVKGAGGWMVDKPAVVIDLMGGRKNLLQAGRLIATEMSFDRPSKADDVLALPDVVAQIILNLAGQ